MNFDDLKDVWNRQALPDWKSLDVAALEREFAAKQQKLARTLFWRDLREAAAGFFVAVVFGRVGWHMGRSGWPIAFAVLIVLGLSVFFLLERVRVRRQRLGADASLVARLDAEIAEQRRQRRLLSGVAVWYLGPIYLAAAIFMATTLAHAPVPMRARLISAGFMVLTFALTGWGVVWLNRRAVRRVIAPRLQELEQWRQSLISSQ